MFPIYILPSACNWKSVTPTWFEHATFWSGVRRATVAPRSLGNEDWTNMIYTILEIFKRQLLSFSWNIDFWIYKRLNLVAPSRLLGATVARLTPDQKVACSNHVGVKFLETDKFYSDVKKWKLQLWVRTPRAALLYVTDDLCYRSVPRNRLKLFWNYFWKNPPPIMNFQVLTSRLIPKFSKKSNEYLLFKVCKVFEFSKMHFWPWKRPKPELLSS